MPTRAEKLAIRRDWLSAELKAFRAGVRSNINARKRAIIKIKAELARIKRGGVPKPL